MEEEQVVSTEQVAEEVNEETKTEETAEETQGTAEEAVDKPKKKTAQERIDELTRKRRDAEREAEYWRKQALKEAPKETPKEPEAPSAKPQSANFDNYEDYLEALAKWTVNREREQARLEEAKRKQQQDADSAWESFNERANKVRAEYEDFDEVIETPPLTDPMRNALLRSDNGPAVAYYLGNNHAEAKRICKLPVELQLVELGKLESKILLAKETPKVTKAPAPVTPVGMGGGKTDKDPSKMTDDEWYAWKKEQQKKEIEDRLKSRGRI